MLRWLIAGCLILTACNGTDDTSSTDADTDTDTDTDTDSDTDSDTQPTGVVMKGTLLGADGNPRTSPMQLCNYDGCRFASPAADGKFVFLGTFQPGPFLYYTASEGAPAATNFTFLVPDDESITEIDTTIVEYDVDSWATVQSRPTTIPAGDGLTITVSTEQVALFDTRDERGGGVRVDLDDLPELEIGFPVAGWYLRPFEAEVKTGQTVPFEITADWTGAGNGTRWEIMLGWYEWESLDIHVIADGKLSGEIPAGKHISSIWVLPGD